MAEMSYWWTTGGAGDGAAIYYTRVDLQIIAQILAACYRWQGICRNFLNDLVGAAGSASADIGIGGAVVDGKPYYNGTVVTVSIPAAVGVGNTRIDRIVLRADWSAQTVRITRIAGVDAGSPTVPSLTQVSGTTYDLPLYRALVNTSGVVTLTDEREFAELGDESVLPGMLADGAVSETAMLADGVVATAKIAADAVDDTKVGNRVPQFYRRQGGSATNWDSRGTTNYTPGAVRMQGGTVTAGSSVTVTFPVAFSARPLVLVTPYSDDGTPPAAGPSWLITSIGTTGFTITSFGFDAEQEAFTWLAIGPE